VLISRPLAIHRGWCRAALRPRSCSRPEFSGCAPTGGSMHLPTCMVPAVAGRVLDVVAGTGLAPGRGQCRCEQALCGAVVRAYQEHGDFACPGCRIRDVAESGVEQPAVAVAADHEQVEAMLGGVVAE